MILIKYKKKKILKLFELIERWFKDANSMNLALLNQAISLSFKQVPFKQQDGQGGVRSNNDNNSRSIRKSSQKVGSLSLNNGMDSSIEQC